MIAPSNISVERLRGPVLRSVSRSFYLSIRLLPPPLRDPVALAYLLARATDTIADTAEIDAGLRAEHLRSLRDLIQAALPHEGSKTLANSFSPLQKNAAESALIEALPDCLLWLDRLEDGDRSDVRSVLEKINQGQALDLQRFRNPNEIVALATADELFQYTYLVAGCVGEFWTGLCFRHLKNFSELAEEEMRSLGKSYGVGLQLINILRDAGADLRAGRCYFPKDELEEAGISAAEILQAPARFEPVYAKWRKEAQSGIDAGMKYSLATRNRRVRAATVLPALIGQRTLALLNEAGVDALRQSIKVPRKEVRTIAATLAITLADRGSISRMFARSAL